MYGLVYATNVGIEEDYERASNEYLDEREAENSNDIDYFKYSLMLIENGLVDND